MFRRMDESAHNRELCSPYFRQRRFLLRSLALWGPNVQRTFPSVKRRNFVLTVGDVGECDGEVAREVFSDPLELLLLEERRRISSRVRARLTLREESRLR
jgi:hypothetical protein